MKPKIVDESAFDTEDLYEILDLKERGLDATEYEMGKQFKEAALIYHPDKKGDKVT